MVSLGDFLSREREARGITLEEIAAATHIRLCFLEALEEDRYRDLPEPPFVEGFLRAYSRYLGIDSSEVIANYRRFILSRDEEREKAARKKSHRILSGITGFLLVGLALGAVFLLTRPSTPVPKEVKEKVVVEPPSIITPTGRPSPENLTRFIRSMQEAQPFTLVFRARDRTWIQTVIDDKKVVDFILQPGQEKSLEVMSRAVVDIGNAGGVQLSINEKDFGFLGETGEVLKGIQVFRTGVAGLGNFEE